jgi:hypothetical protein
MANTVNLKQARKERTRAKKRSEADGNALKYGQTREEKARRLAEMKLAQARFEAHKREPGKD